MPAVAGPSLSLLRRRLLAWFTTNQRVLPWRHDRDPYRIWVSEVMLQQTLVATVIRYYERFLRRFPTVQKLAAAGEQDVLRLWEGLGYYRRARNLHRAAQILVADHAGQLPDDPEVWSSLPGVGRYILGAVLSQAFDRRLPIVEANSQRVLCRLFGRTADPRSAVEQKWLWQKAADLVPEKRAGDFNQALMELGALVCTLEKPRCEQCPLARRCTARQEGTTNLIPVRRDPKSIEELQHIAVVVWRRGRVLLVRRPEGVRWAGMWEFPQGPARIGETIDVAAVRLLKHVTGVTARVGTKLATLRHSVTRYRITMTCVEAEFRRGQFHSKFYQDGKWLPPAKLRRYPVSSAHRKLADLLLNRCQRIRSGVAIARSESQASH